jgi:uncharacterized protein YjiS (DUF1127 family)
MTTQQATRNSGIIHAISEAWNRYRKRRAALAELQGLGRAELSRMINDAGLTFGDAVELTKQSGASSELLYRRLEAAGIDVEKLDAAVMRDMQRCCTFCDSKSKCAHEFDDKPKAASWPAYCPNQLTIEALSAAKCH